MARLRSVRGWLLVALLVGGCASASSVFVSLPPIPDAGKRTPSRVVWHDLLTADPAGAQRFYGGVFGWQFTPVSDHYVLVRNGDRAIGGIATVEAAAGSQWIAQFAVEDIARSATVAERAGGTILFGPTNVGDRGQLVLVRDPQAAVFGMIQTRDGDPAESTPRYGDWLWHELWVTDPAASAAYYKQVLSFFQRTQQVDGSPYDYFMLLGTARAGLVRKPDPTLGNTWVSYVRVSDIEAVVARATQFGGRVMFAPDPGVRHGSLAILADPGGAGVVVQQWPLGGK
jgi:uncharacterized protein